MSVSATKLGGDDLEDLVGKRDRFELEGLT
jgi:hypothetical protein